MGKLGRIFAVSIILSIHTVYSIYYYFRDGSLDYLDILGYPLLFGIAYWSGKQFDKAKFYSEKDILTNLYNRRFVISNFSKFLSSADRTNNRLFVLIIDCDKFKSINDNYGHNKGDLVLTNIAKILLYSTRNGDIVARWGGDEFLIIGNYKGDEELQVFLQKLNHEIEIFSRQMTFDVKVSIGTTIYPDDSRDLDELIRIADQNMYKCKENKRRSEHKITDN